MKDQKDGSVLPSCVITMVMLAVGYHWTSLWDSMLNTTSHSQPNLSFRIEVKTPPTLHPKGLISSIPCPVWKENFQSAKARPSQNSSELPNWFPILRIQLELLIQHWAPWQRASSGLAAIQVERPGLRLQSSVPPQTVTRQRMLKPTEFHWHRHDPTPNRRLVAELDLARLLAPLLGWGPLVPKGFGD